MPALDFIENYLLMQPLIEARLSDQLAADKIPVEGIEDMASAGVDDKRAKVVYVLWGGDRIIDADNARALGGAAQKIYQDWVVLLHLRNASKVDRAARNKEAGALLGRLHRALAGWSPVQQPGSPHRFTRINGPRPDYAKVSGLYPMAFSIPIHL